MEDPYFSCLLLQFQSDRCIQMTPSNHSQMIPNNKEVIIGASNQNGQMISVGSFLNTIQLVQ